jgi:hypothetical protein
MTTVKVRKDTRARLAEQARAQHSTIDEYLTRLLDEQLWRDRMAEARRCMHSADASYAEETADWEVTTDDGLA